MTPHDLILQSLSAKIRVYVKSHETRLVHFINALLS